MPTIRVQRELRTNETIKNLVNLMRAESTVNSHLEINVFKYTADNSALKKTIYIFSGYEYEVSFYDEKMGCKRCITGVVDSITGNNFNPSGQFITLKYLEKNDKHENTEVCGMPPCRCILNKPPLYKYDGPSYIDIPVYNIFDINYLVSHNPKPPIPLKGVKVLLVGITATTVKAIIVDLKFLYDGCDQGIKAVSLEVGKTYNVAYYSLKDRTVYEITGKLINISEVDRPVNIDSAVRFTQDYTTTSDPDSCEFDKNSTGNRRDINGYKSLSPISNKDVSLVFDTSTEYEGEYQTIMLSWLRDCDLVESEEDDTEVSTPEEDTSTDTPSEVENKVIEIQSGNMTVSIDPSNESVEFVDENGDKNTITLKEVIDYYFGN